jgi:hypothetical protein
MLSKHLESITETPAQSPLLPSCDSNAYETKSDTAEFAEHLDSTVDIPACGLSYSLPKQRLDHEFHCQKLPEDSVATSGVHGNASLSTPCKRMQKE